MGSTLGRLRAQCRVMRAVVRNWPTLTQCLAGMAIFAGCHGMEPLQVEVQDPLKRNDRDVVFAGSGSGSGSGCTPDTCTATAGRVAPGIAGRGSQSSGIDAMPDAGSRSRGSTGAAGRTGARGSGRAAAGQDGGAAGASSASAGRGATTPGRGRPTRPTSSTAGSSGSPAAGSTGADSSICGNDIIEPRESCEQTDLNGFSCASFGYPAGVLLCDPFTCLFDLSQCRRQPQGGSGTEPVDASVTIDAGAGNDSGSAGADAGVADAAVPDDDAGAAQGL
jgi:hypothetical protein